MRGVSRDGVWTGGGIVVYEWWMEVYVYVYVCDLRV